MFFSFALFIQNLRFNTRSLRCRLGSTYDIIQDRPTARRRWAAATPVRE
jgi:hypothetical protein